MALHGGHIMCVLTKAVVTVAACRLCRILVALTILWVVVAAARLAQEDVESHRPAYENCTSATSASGGVGL